MFKALFKKQFAELNAFYFFDKKTGKLRSKGRVVGICILYAFLFITLAGVFAILSFSVGASLLSVDLNWLYFATLGLIAIALGVFGSVFNTFSGLYQAKDNELLLSMPIPPAYILAVRICSVCLMSLLYTSLVWLPACVVYFVMAKPSGLAVLWSLLLTVVLTAFVSVLTCALGWLVALIAGKLKNKSYITVILSLAFIAAYYFIYFRFNQLLATFVQNSEKVGDVMKTWLFPLYMLGRAASGETVPMLIFTGITAALCALCLFILSRGFIRIVTTSGGSKKIVYRAEKQAKIASPARALMRKELKRFTSSSTYMLNCGLGLVLMPVLAVVALVRAPALRQMIDEASAALPGVTSVPAGIAMAALFFVLSTSIISAPSISLEGKSLWIVRSMPVSSRDVLLAKERVHVLLNVIPAAVSVVILGVVTRADPFTLLFMFASCGLYIYFTADFGLWLNLRHPSLDWTSETVPVKQGFAVMTLIFVGMGISFVVAVLTGVGGIVLSFLPACVPLAFVTAVLTAVVLPLRRKLFRRGVEIFEEL